MKFPLFCLMSLWIADVCKTSQDTFVDIYIRSEGCNDPNIAPNSCGFAYIKVNGIDHSPHGRGHNVVSVDATTGAVLGAMSFDTHGDGNAGNSLRDYLNGIQGDEIVLVAIQDAGSNHVSEAIDALKRLGATDPILTEFRGSYALAGYAGLTKPSWITQQQANSGQGPSEITLRIPLTSNCFDSPVGVGSLSIIPDNQMSASSQYADGYQAAYGRLNGDRGDGWCAQEAARNDDWLQVDLGKPTEVCALATQGDRNGNEWVKAFKLSYSSDGTTWSTYQDSSGADVEFQRLGDSNTIDQHKLPVPVFARYFRFNPTLRNNWNCLRVEIYSFVCFDNPVGVGSLSLSIMTNYMLLEEHDIIVNTNRVVPFTQLNGSLEATELGKIDHGKINAVPIKRPRHS
ncbi:hypothetical protein ACROYT_G002249 [Oculina patagonica]